MPEKQQYITSEGKLAEKTSYITELPVESLGGLERKDFTELKDWMFYPGEKYLLAHRFGIKENIKLHSGEMYAGIYHFTMPLTDVPRRFTSDLTVLFKRDVLALIHHTSQAMLDRYNKMFSVWVPTQEYMIEDLERIVGNDRFFDIMEKKRGKGKGKKRKN